MRVLIGIASIPQRERCLRETLESLIPQVEEVGGCIYVYLNGYDGHPAWYREYDKVVCLLDRGHRGDLGDAGKFYPLNFTVRGKGYPQNENAPSERLPWDYYLACDDDLIYPETYVQDMTAAVDRYNRRAVVSIHGWNARPNQRSYHRDRAGVAHYKHDVPQDVLVHVVGTGVCAFHRLALPDLRLEHFEDQRTADLYLSRHANERRVPRIVLAHRGDYVKDSALYDQWQSIWGQCSRNPERERRQTEALNAVRWTHGDLESLNEAA